MKYRIYTLRNMGHRNKMKSGNKIGLTALVSMDDLGIQPTTDLYEMLEEEKIPAQDSAWSALNLPQIKKKIQPGDILMLQGRDVKGAWLINRLTKTNTALEELPEFFQQAKTEKPAIFGKDKPAESPKRPGFPKQLREAAGREAEAQEAPAVKPKVKRKHIEFTGSLQGNMTDVMNQLKATGRRYDFITTTGYIMAGAHIVEVGDGWMQINHNGHNKLMFFHAISTILLDDKKPDDKKKEEPKNAEETEP